MKEIAIIRYGWDHNIGFDFRLFKHFFALGYTRMPSKGVSMKTNKPSYSRFRILIISLLGILALIYVILFGYRFEQVGFGDYLSPKIDDGVTFQRAKTLWDWMSLLGIPIVLTFGVWYINFSTQKRIKLSDEEQAKLEKEKTEKRERFEKWIEYDRAREQALQEYLSSMENLILRNGLLESTRGHPVREIARARTFDILRRLDGDRKRLVADFLYQTGLIYKTNPCISLVATGFGSISDPLPGSSAQRKHQFADYFIDVERAANLHHIYLKDADFQRANLNDVGFVNATLEGVDFSNSDLYHANLCGANMQGAILVGAKLIYAQLNAANLENANLSSADLNRALMNDAVLRNANFSNTDLRHAELRNADLQNTDLRTANLSDAVLDQANLKYCKISEDQLNTVRSYKDAILPDK
jgi:uncharacterized protein YjbI with pentapeptide repeats